MARVPRGLVLAMDLLRAPVLAETMRRQPLLPSEDILILLRIAGGCPETSKLAVGATGAPLEQIRRAVILYLKRVLLFPDADSYRVLGLLPGARHETIREHLRWMMRWLHPDRNREEWEAVYADRVLRAWDDLKTSGRREDYDRRNAVGAASDAGRRQSSLHKRGIPWIAASIRQRHRRHQLADVVKVAVAYASLAGVLAFLAWQVVAPAWIVDPAGERVNASAAGGNSAALVRLAEAHIADAQGNIEWAQVRRLARRALLANPLENGALLLLGLAVEAEGDEQRAAGLVSLAGARTLRDLRSHLWLFDRRLGEADFASALDHADVLLRVHPQLKATLLPYLMAMTALPAGRASMVERLGAGPPWRGWFLDAYSRNAADPSDPTPIYSALQSGPHPPGSDELRPHLERLIEAGRFEQALVLWMRSLAPDQAADLVYLYNGSFSQPVTNLAFDWVFGQAHGAEIGIAASPMGDGKALRVQFGRARVPFKHVRKLLVLPPGSYEMSGDVMAVDLRNERGLQWTITCAEGQREALLATARITGTVRAEIAEPFSVPAKGCRAQWLQLELAARIAPEQDVDGGTVWYEALRIRRLGAANPS